MNIGARQFASWCCQVCGAEIGWALRAIEALIRFPLHRCLTRRRPHDWGAEQVTVNTSGGVLLGERRFRVCRACEKADDVAGPHCRPRVFPR